MSEEPSALLDLARKTFKDLSPAEREVIRSAERGRVAILPDVIKDVEDGHDPSVHTAEERGNYLVRAALLRWLCSDKQAVTYVSSRGVDLFGGKIEEALDLGSITIPFPLYLKRCWIPLGIGLEFSTVENLNLSDCRTSQVMAVWLVARKDVLFANLIANGGVILDSARIAGSLYCWGGVFISPDDTALSAHGSRIEGDVYLSDGFHAEGEVHFVGCVIGGSLKCMNAQFHNPAKDSEKGKIQRAAFSADGISIGGSAFMRHDLEIVGETRMIGATVTGALDCTRARFINPGKTALIAERMQVGGDVFFTDGFEVEGSLWLPGASIGGNLDFGGAKFTGTGRFDVNLETATITKTLFWQGVKATKEMYLNLNDAEARLYWDDMESWPQPEHLSIFGFKYGRITGAKTAEARRQWLELQVKEKANLQPYEHLAAVMRESGNDAESRKVLIAKEDVRYRHGGMNRLARVWGYVLKATIGYGYMPRRALYWSLTFLLFGWLVFSAGYKSSLFSPVSDGVYRDPAYQKSQTLPGGYQTFNPLIYSLDVFLPIIDLHQEANWLPDSSRPCMVAGRTLSCGSYLRTYLWIHIIVGWALTTLAVAGFTGLIRND